MYRNLKFLHMTNFFSTDTVLVSVTNIRYVSVSLDCLRVSVSKLYFFKPYFALRHSFCIWWLWSGALREQNSLGMSCIATLSPSPRNATIVDFHKIFSGIIAVFQQQQKSNFLISSPLWYCLRNHTSILDQISSSFMALKETECFTSNRWGLKQ